MEYFDNIISQLDKVNISNLGRHVFSQSNIQKWMIDTIQKRLYNLGESADGTDLKTDKSSSGNPYADVTMDIKSYLGQRTDNVTFKDSGSFYKSFKILLKQNSVNIEADFYKGGDHIGDNFEFQFSNLKDFENAIAGLSDIEIDEMLKTKVYPEAIRYLNSQTNVT